jgi:hypothetical protein
MKRLLLLLSLSISVIRGFSQNAAFNSIEDNIKSNISKNNWDEVILLSTDLIIEDPARPEGYYYTALSFLKMNAPDKAKYYLEKSESLADSDFETKISKLKEQISLFNQVQKLSATGDKNSAEYWYRLWDADRRNTDYALSAVEIYVSNKKYDEAVKILESPEFSKDKDAQTLLSRIKNTPEMKKLSNYKTYLDFGNAAMENKNFSSAVIYYNTAAENNPNNAELKGLIKTAEDEEAWQTAQKENSIDSYENYLSSNTIQKHSDEANQTLKEAYVYWGSKYAEDDDISNMELYFSKYKNKYPGGKEISKINSVMCQTYYRNGKSKSAEKYSSSQQTAIKYFELAQQYCPENYQTLKSDLNKSYRLEKRYSRDDRTYFAYIYDSISPIGLSIGTINNNSFGAYFSTGINNNIFTETAYFTVNNSGVFDGEVFTDLRKTGESKIGAFNGMVGLTKKIIYPLWIYGGLGIDHKRLILEVDEYDDSGDFYETVWVRNTDESYWKPAYEAGLIIDFSGFFLRGGLKTLDFSDYYLNFGIGFSITR